MGSTATVILSEMELALANYAGILISDLSKAAGLKDHVIRPGATSVSINQIGMIGEMCVAKCLDLYWGGSAFTFHAADLNHNIECRTISNPNYGLKVRETDADDKKVVGVRMPLDISTRTFTVVGWIMAGDGKREQWSRNPYAAGPFFAVPLDMLLPIETLKLLIARERWESEQDL